MKTHSQEDWVVVSPQDLSQVKSTEERGITLQFMVSPADMPTAWRARLMSHDVVALEFKYLTDSEPKKIVSQGNGIVLEVGKNSRRIYKILLEVALLHGSSELIIRNTSQSINHARDLNKSNSKVIQNFLSPSYSKPEFHQLLQA